MPTHRKPESERFKGPAKYAEYLFARALIAVLRRLPVRAAHRLGRGVGWLAWKCLKRRRATVRKNLEIVNAWMDARSADGGSMMADGGDELKAGRRKSTEGAPSDLSSFIPHPSSAIEAQVREVFQRAGANLFAGFTFNRMSPGQAAEHIRIEGVEHLKSALDEGRGVIVLLAHMGPWEALAQLPGLAQQQYGVEAPFGAMYRPLNNNYLDNWYRRQREARGTRLFSRRDGFHKPVDFLRGGGMLGILSDQKIREGVDAAFFGRMLKTTPIPGLFQRRSGAPVVAVSVSTSAPRQWTIRLRAFQLPVAADPKDRTPFARSLNAALETMFCDSLCDGFWMQARFSAKDSRVDMSI